MKKSISGLRIVQTTVVVFGIAMSMALWSCGGSGGTKETGKEGEDNGEGTEKVIDTKAHSDSKGVGRFTEVKLEALKADMAAKGKTVFDAKCTACHLVTDQKKVGPGLKGVTARRTPEWIMNMITNPAGMLAQDAVAKQLLKELLTPMTFQNVTDDDARTVLEYLRENDGK